MRTTPRRGALALLAAATALGGGRLAAQAPAVPVQYGVTVSPDTVAVGDPFVVRVRVRAPRGAAVEFPLAPDSASKVELLDPRAVRNAPDTTATDVTAVYRAAAWDVGARRFGFTDVYVRAGGRERRIALGTAGVFVRSVLPADTAAPRDPKPPRGIFEPQVPWWRRWLPFLLAALVAALLVWWLWRRFRRRAATPQLDAFAQAEAGFARIDGLGLLEAGERGRYVTLVVEVLRDYLARRLPEAHASLTSRELTFALGAHEAVPVDRLGALLGESDLVKFARHPVTAERARALGVEARGIVGETEAALQQREAERAAAEAAAHRPVQVTTKRPSEPPTRAA